jgi:hypothetical protein
MSLSELHTMGGAPFMWPIDLAAIINLSLIGYLLYCHFTKNDLPEKWIETFKHVGGFALAAGAFGTLVGLFQAFDAIEGSKDVIPFPVICGGLKVGLITVIYGLIVYMITLLFYIAFSLLKRNKN